MNGFKKIDFLYSLLRNSTAVLRFPQFFSRILNTLRKSRPTKPCIEIARHSAPKSLVRSLVCLLILLGASSLHSEVADRIVAVVNQEPVTLFEVHQLVVKMEKSLDRLSPAERKSIDRTDLTKKALENLIDEKLMSQEMQKHGVKISDEQVQQAIQAILKNNKMTLDGLKKELAKQNLTLENYKKSLREQLKRQGFLQQVVGGQMQVSDSEIEAFYRKNVGGGDLGGEIQIAQLVIPLDASATEADLRAAKKKADEIYSKAKQGKSFDQLIKEYGGPGSGDLGKVSVSGLNPDLVVALQRLEKGGVTEPLLANGGVVLVKLVDRFVSKSKTKEANLSIDPQLKEEIRNRLFEMKAQEELKRYLQQLKNKSFVEIKEV